MAKKVKLKAVENTALEDAEEVTPKASEETESPKATEKAAPPISEVTKAELDAEEEEFRAMRRDLPGAKGVSAAGIVTISVGKAPQRNTFFRSWRGFCPVVPLVDLEVGMERQFFAVSSNMVVALNSIGIAVADHALFLTITAGGALRIVPVRQAIEGEEPNEYNRTKEIALTQSFDQWVRMYVDKPNHCYKVFPAVDGRFGEPQFPDMPHAKIFKYGFRDKGRLIDSIEHPLFLKWASRDTD